MATRFRHFALCAAATAGLACLSCTNHPASPSRGDQGGNQPGPGSAVTTVGLRLVAPQEIAPGESVQLTANALKSDGSVEDVSSQVQWTVESFPEGVLAVTATGLVTGMNRGRALVMIGLPGFTADATIFVLPNGTFRVTGRVTADGVGLQDASVTVIDGVGGGTSARTNVSGDYELYGLAGLVQVRASRDGYLDLVQQVVVQTHRSLAFELTPDTELNHYVGMYTLIITGTRCSPTFPDAATRRVYTAQIEQSGATLQVALSGADFLAGSDGFRGVVTASGEISFTIRPASVWDYDGADLQERLTDGTVLLIMGLITARRTPAGISGEAKWQEAGLGGIFHLPPRGSGWSLADATGTCYIDSFEMIPRAH